MKTVRVTDGRFDEELLQQASDVLKQGGLVCLPCRSNYRIVADLTDDGAVERLLQSKRRVRKAPSLVFVDSEQMLRRVAAEVPELAARLADRLWPGPVTIQFQPHADLSPRAIKQLIKANGRLGVRIPAVPAMLQVIGHFGGPLLVSSANREKKSGAGSPAQVRKNFAHSVDLFVDAGDLPAGESSTVIRIEDGRFEIIRPGILDAEQIAAAAG